MMSRFHYVPGEYLWSIFFSRPKTRPTSEKNGGGDCKGNGTPAVSGKTGRLVKYGNFFRLAK